MSVTITPTTAVNESETDHETLQESRTVSGLALPWDTYGYTPQGQIKVPRGSIAIPEDLKRIKLFRDHSDVGGTPIGYCTGVEDTDDGLFMTFSVSRTPDGDTAIADVSEGVRDALSVELASADLVGDEIGSANLMAVALVAIPAFEDARVHAFTASFSDTKKENTMTTTPTTPTETKENTVTDTAPTETKDDTTMEPTTAAPAKAPAALVTARTREPAVTFARAVEAITANRDGRRENWITAALKDITQAAHVDQRAPQWLGELWEGNAYKREIVPTMTSRPLTSMKAVGWRWTTKPTVADYAGNKAEIPSNTPATELVNLEIKRLAGGHDIDRAYFDFNDKEFLESYFRAMSESYAMESDDRAAKFLAAEAAKNKGTKQADLLRAAAKAKQMIKLATRTEATSYLVHPDDMFSLLEITTMDNPAYLKLVGVDPAAFIATEHAKKGSVIAYAKPAVEFRELAGSPIRVQAEHLSHGGIDSALFGYYATFTANQKGIAQVEFGAAA